MKLNIKFGIQFEKNRIKNTFSKLSWYKAHGYNLEIPLGINEESSDEEIIVAVKLNFKEKDYENHANKLMNDFSLIEKKFHNALKKTFRDQKISDTLEIYLTKYGTGGSYNLPNIVIKNISHSKSGVKTIFHEIIHLMIEPLVKKFGVNQWEKERIVDLILNSKEFDFLKYNSWQPFYQGTERYIDSLFNKQFFGNPVAFFSMINETRTRSN